MPGPRNTFWTFGSEPETLNSKAFKTKPETLNPKAFKTKPETLNPKAFKSQLQVISHLVAHHGQLKRRRHCDLLADAISGENEAQNLRCTPHLGEFCSVGITVASSEREREREREGGRERNERFPMNSPQSKVQSAQMFASGMVYVS